MQQHLRWVIASSRWMVGSLRCVAGVYREGDALSVLEILPAQGFSGVYEYQVGVTDFQFCFLALSKESGLSGHMVSPLLSEVEITFQ